MARARITRRDHGAAVEHQRVEHLDEAEADQRFRPASGPRSSIVVPKGLHSSIGVTCMTGEPFALAALAPIGGMQPALSVICLRSRTSAAIIDVPAVAGGRCE